MFTRAAMLALIATFAIAGSASAASTVGQTFAPAIPNLPDNVNFGFSTATVNSNAAATNGVLTSFSQIAEASPDATLRLVVMRQTATGFLTIAVSEAQTLPNGILGSWPVRIPVLAGDRIGVMGDTSALAAATETMNPSDVFLAFSTPTLTPGTEILNGSLGDFNGYVLDISAQLEADADGDGFGDETQDLCPTAATTQGACPDGTAPALKFKYSKSVKGGKSVSFKATPNEASRITVTGSFKVGGKTHKIKKVTKVLTANKSSKVTIKLPSGVKTAIADGKKAKGSFTVLASDPSGNRRAYKLKTTIK